MPTRSFPAGRVIAVNSGASHSFSKGSREEIILIEGKGVEGDAHCGEKVRHRSRVAKNPDQPNLRQVHLLHEELFHELLEKGFVITPGDIGENITTRGLDLLALPRGSVLRIGGEAVVRITGLRNPCVQLNDFQKGLMQAVIGKDADGNPVYKAGVMGIVLSDGRVKPGDSIQVDMPEGQREKLDFV